MTAQGRFVVSTRYIYSYAVSTVVTKYLHVRSMHRTLCCKIIVGYLVVSPNVPHMPWQAANRADQTLKPQNFDIQSRVMTNNTANQWCL